MNQTLETILTRRSTRKFLEKPIPEAELKQIVEAALCAPSGKNAQTWKFTVVTSRPMIEKLARGIEVALNRSGYNMYQPVALVIPSNQKESPFGKEDNACALENIFLAAHSLGIGSVWINQLQGICDDPVIRLVLDELQIPADHVVYGMAALGYSDEEPKPIKRVGEVAYIK